MCGQYAGTATASRVTVLSVVLVKSTVTMSVSLWVADTGKNREKKGEKREEQP